MTDSNRSNEHDHDDDGERVVADDGLLVDEGEVVDDGMGPDAPADVAGEDAPVDSDASDPLDEATGP